MAMPEAVRQFLSTFGVLDRASSLRLPFPAGNLALPNDEMIFSPSKTPTQGAAMKPVRPNTKLLPPSTKSGSCRIVFRDAPKSGSRRTLLLFSIVVLLAGSATAFITVNSTGNESDVAPGDGICGTVLTGGQSSGPCTLRAAIEEANAHAGPDIITFNIPASDANCASGVCTITLSSRLPNLSTDITINGPGPALLTVRGTSSLLHLRVISVMTTGTVNLSGLTISNGTAGGVSNLGSGTLNVTNCTISNNGNGTTRGAGLFNGDTATTNMTNTTVSANLSGDAGGGVYNEGTALTITGSTIAANHVVAFSSNTSPGGGGVLGQRLRIVNSTINGNVSDGTGGGIDGSDNVIVNSTIAGNFAATAAGGIFASLSNQITNCTITGNSVTMNLSGALGGGVYFAEGLGGLTTIKSTIIALNTTANKLTPDVRYDNSNTPFTSAGFNLVGKDDGGRFTAATDRHGTVASPLDPKLDPNGLQNNGGPTQTVGLLVGSPAIDKGTSIGLTGQLTTDQRGSGFPRMVDNSAIQNASGGDGTDIGAFEVQAIPTVLANISTRLPVQTGDNVLIGGFIVTGTQNKKVIIRALGPSVPVPGALANPTLELYSGSTLLESNDNWVDSPNKQAIIDSTIPPSNNLESAIVRTLPANSSAYTAIVRGVNTTTGIAVVEAYDLDRSVDSKLANISTRGFVQTGDNVLIAGTIILGQTPQKVIIRAIGPSLSVAGKLADPTLQLIDGNGTVLEENNNWVDSPNKQAIIDSTIPPSNDLESAIVRTLPANGAQYTAIVRGVNDSTGIAVVELYALN
ncbi:MAG: hypothetical protein DME97_10950 [Verrucomicrobia bacterium]|nr:MAG: hypothetical protein DME97_10950 [Verrucomicrobiota bacterium]